MEHLNQLISALSPEDLKTFFKENSISEFLTFTQINVEEVISKIILSVQFAKGKVTKPSAITTLNEYLDFINKHFEGICKPLLEEDYNLDLEEIANSIYERTNNDVNAIDVYEMISNIKNKLGKFFNSNSYDFNAFNLFISFTGIHQLQYYVKEIVLDLGDKNTDPNTIKKIGLNRYTEEEGNYFMKKIKVINYLHFLERFLVYVNKYSVTLIDKTFELHFQTTPTASSDHILSDNLRLNNNFKPRKSTKITPDVLKKCIEYRDNEVLKPTNIFIKTATYFNNLTTSITNMADDGTTIRNWIKANKEIIPKFKNKGEAKIINSLTQNDIDEWFNALAQYDSFFKRFTE